MKRLETKKYVITEGRDEIGLGIAKAFAQNGVGVYLIARNLEKDETQWVTVSIINVDGGLTTN